MRYTTGDKPCVCPNTYNPDVLTLTYLGLNNINLVFALFTLNNTCPPRTQPDLLRLNWEKKSNLFLPCDFAQEKKRKLASIIIKFKQFSGVQWKTNTIVRIFANWILNEDWGPRDLLDVMILWGVGRSTDPVKSRQSLMIPVIRWAELSWHWNSKRHLWLSPAFRQSYLQYVYNRIFNPHSWNKISTEIQKSTILTATTRKLYCK